MYRYPGLFRICFNLPLFFLFLIILFVKEVQYSFFYRYSRIYEPGEINFKQIVLFFSDASILKSVAYASIQHFVFVKIQNNLFTVLRFVVTLLSHNELVVKRFDNQFRVVAFSGILPTRNVRELVVVAERFTFRSLELFTEVSTATFFAE